MHLSWPRYAFYLSAKQYHYDPMPVQMQQRIQEDSVLIKNRRASSRQWSQALRLRCRRC